MKELSRTQNSAKNLFFGTGMYIFTQIVSFVSRTVFINLLGDQYLGISGLYSNILSLLALADLGITTAFTFSLYKPLAEKDNARIATLLGFFKKVFWLIAAIVFLIGLGFVPFLKYIIKDNTLPYSDLQLYFILSVVNSACSYLAVYKSAVFRADQKVYIVNSVSAITNLFLHILQIALLYITGDYIFYLVAAIVVTLLNNLILTIWSNKAYPQIFVTKAEKVSSDDKKQIFSNLKSLILYRVSAAIMSSTSNILISVLLGTVIVGYYSNYSMVVVMITAIIGILCNSMLASIGNLGTKANGERQGEMFHTILLLFYGAGTFCSVCLICLFNDFIILWLQDSRFLLTQTDVILITFTFFVTCVSNPIWMFRESLGLFNKAKYVMTFAAVINILLAIIGGKLLGVGGIIAATGVARLLTMFWYEPRYLYRDAFKMPYCEYWKHTIFYLIQTLITVGACVVSTYLLKASFVNMFVKAPICGVITIIVFMLFNFKTKEGNALIQHLKTMRKSR